MNGVKRSEVNGHGETIMDNKACCACSILEETHEFCSILEFERFREYIAGIVNDGELIEIPVQKSYSGFPEQWYKCKSCFRIWKLEPVLIGV